MKNTAAASIKLMGSTATRGWTALVIAAAALFTSGCNTASTESNLMLFAENAPLPTLVERGTELVTAEREARLHRSSFAVQGEGSSMEPVYLPGTALVVRAGGYEDLRPGTPVVYANRRGIAVAHMLVEQTTSGWLAVGLNNEASDSELVTADNLVGVVTHAFASKTGSLPQAAAARMALNDQIRRGAKVASLGR